jgi:hypothetical protein
MGIRLDATMLERADELLDHVTKVTGRTALRADVIRLAIARGLRELELERAADKRR